MSIRAGEERGQAIIEFAILGLVLLAMTAGIIDVGRAFYQYNAMSNAARFGARWGSVVGGSCALPYSQSTSDWCNKNNSSNAGTLTFWGLAGNKPQAGVSTTCPDYSSSPSSYYTVSTQNAADVTAGGQPTTIVGAVVQKFDSDLNSAGLLSVIATPGVDTSQLKVCIAVSGSSIPRGGDTISVKLYLPFKPSSTFFLNGATIDLYASSQFRMEGGTML